LIPGLTFSFVKKEDMVEIRQHVTFELQVRALKNVPGVYINAENCQSLESLKLDEVPLTHKCTNYWVTFED
jgi:hypothetical protein